MRTLSSSPGFDSLLTLSEHPNSSEFLITPELQRTLTVAEVRLGRPETQLQGPRADQGPRNLKLDHQFDFGNLAPHVLINSSTGDNTVRLALLSDHGRGAIPASPIRRAAYLLPLSAPSPASRLGSPKPSAAPPPLPAASGWPAMPGSHVTRGLLKCRVT